jgi:hypothetical protein
MHTIEYIGGPLDGMREEHDQLHMTVNVGIETSLGWSETDYELSFRDGYPFLLAAGVTPRRARHELSSSRPCSPDATLGCVDTVGGVHGLVG